MKHINIQIEFLKKLNKTKPERINWGTSETNDGRTIYAITEGHVLYFFYDDEWMLRFPDWKKINLDTMLANIRQCTEPIIADGKVIDYVSALRKDKTYRVYRRGDVLAYYDNDYFKNLEVVEARAKNNFTARDGIAIYENDVLRAYVLPVNRNNL